ncbi:hypothetical protein LEP1GSC202_1767 [Leptospira yanagawae serovar Saopaulo str. Sao Paulo = ATCC 700523]|uniref:Uncharacterized protein n=1 Tax=Leptospira yanagawae serovar Saopaulo str. Sao Paulo = ATCC 700523 TaxID=1249483 RepID=A0A5E8HFY8_9LEPT|nr:hypothetical protein [Leptospira yanagawae]EOQ89832.1 hypothetical protein LEP1GSC202_1767 [Leptospira yanagawae serovar Saopaulo str. Sao Paulo = ATCC 700523]
MNSIDLNDLPTLKEFSIIAYKWLSEHYPKFDHQTNFDLSHEIVFPIRWKTKMEGELFEWVVSDMGSITLRLGGVEGNRRNPAPIFYLSLRKLEGDVFSWADPEGNPVSFPNPSVIEDVRSRVQLYLDSRT